MFYKSPIYASSYRPHFSGHETFPMRYGWLKKAFDTVENSKNKSDNKSIFLGDDAIARFGVGKNMVTSIRYWATSSGIIEEKKDSKSIVTTQLGNKLFGTNGLDPYLENISTLWLIHWQLTSKPERTTWFWTFNHFQRASFERAQIVQNLLQLADDQGWSRVSKATIKRDVECFVRSYVFKPILGKSFSEDALESPLSELGLIRPVGQRDGFKYARGPKPSLGNGIFLYSVADFWQKHTDSKTLSFENIAYAPGSPGRVFLLDENDISERLFHLEKLSKGLFTWSETAGLKQLILNRDLYSENHLAYIESEYPSQ